MSIGRRVAAQNREEHGHKIATLKKLIVAEFKKAGPNQPLSNNDLYAGINAEFDRVADRLKIIPMADISSATSALKKAGVLVEVGTAKNEKGNTVTTMTLGEWAAVPPDRRVLVEASRLRRKITRELGKADPETQVALAKHCLRYIARKQAGRK